MNVILESNINIYIYICTEVKESQYVSWFDISFIQEEPPLPRGYRRDSIKYTSVRYHGAANKTSEPNLGSLLPHPQKAFQ